jgi:hypothetical protein
MSPEKLTPTHSPSALLVGQFTTQEAERLHAMYKKVNNTAEYVERFIDEHRARLRFTQYLIAVGDISEDQRR